MKWHENSTNHGKKTWITLHNITYTNRQWRFKTPDFVHSSAERTFNSKDSKVQIGPAVRNHPIREVGVTHQHQCSCTITVRTSAGQWNNRLAPMKSVPKNRLVSKLKALIAFFGGWKIVWTTWRLGVVTNGLETSWAFCGRKRTTQNLIHSFVFGCFRHGYMSDKLNTVCVHEWYKNAYSTLWLRTAHMIYVCMQNHLTARLVHYPPDNEETPPTKRAPILDSRNRILKKLRPIYQNKRSSVYASCHRHE